jgi:hypothetical protein
LAFCLFCLFFCNALEIGDFSSFDGFCGVNNSLMLNTIVIHPGLKEVVHDVVIFSLGENLALIDVTLEVNSLGSSYHDADVLQSFNY